MARNSEGKGRKKTPDEVYAEAVDQVTRAVQKRALHLRLGKGRRGLTRIPNLSNLESLKTLDLSGTGVTEISPISELTSLHELSLGWTRVVDLSPIAGLRSLQKLSLTGSSVRDLTPLKNLKLLEELSISGSEGTDLSPLAHLSRLQELNFPLGASDDWSPLARLGTLRRLSLFRAKGGDWDWLRKLTQLRDLFLDHADISDLSVVAGMSKLEILDISGTSISDLMPIRRLGSLTDLLFDGTPVSDLEPLRGMSGLKKIDMDRTAVSDLSPLEELRQLQRISFDGTKVSDLTSLAELTSLVSAVRKVHNHGLSFSDCPVSDPVLLKFAKIHNPKRTIETIAYLRQSQGLRPLTDVDAQDQSNDYGSAVTPAPPLEAIPSPEPRAVQFSAGKGEPIDLLSVTAPGEALADASNHREDYAELRLKATDLKSLGPNRLGHLFGSIDRFLSLPEDINAVRANLFWSRINTLRIKLAAHEQAAASRIGEPDDRLLESSAAPLLKDLVETINVFVLHDPILMDLDSVRPGPQERSVGREELALLAPVLDEATSNAEVATQATREALEEQIDNIKMTGDALFERQAVGFGRRSIQNFIGEVLRRAYAPVREATKFESGVAWKGIREGAYRAVGAGLVTAAATDLLSVTSFYGTFANFVARHAESLISYVTKVFQNPALIDIINWISKFGL